MSRLAIKICGLSTAETVGAAVRAGASHLGFVHFGRSPRHVEPEQMRALAAAVPSHVERVAVVVDADDAGQIFTGLFPIVSAGTAKVQPVGDYVAMMKVREQMNA